MRTFALLVAAPSLVHGLEQQLAPGVVKLDLHRREFSPGEAALRPLSRRQTLAFEEVITNEVFRGGYFSTCNVGTPPQPLILQLDTGSSDTWVPHAAATICSERFTVDACSLGSYDPAESSTHQRFLTGQFNISYVDSTYSLGDYFNDTLEIGGAVVKNMTMGLGINTTINHGLVGVGYATNEVSLKVGVSYDNLPVAMLRQGLIKTMAYSLYLNDLDSSTGSILFGGVDHAKYSGDLVRINVLPDPSRANKTFTHFEIPLTSLSATSSTGTDTLTSESFPIGAVLDSGTTLTYLPNDIVQQAWKDVGVEYYPRFSGGNGLIPCSRKRTSGHFTFGFAGPNGPKISIGMDELVINLLSSGAPLFPSGSKYEGQEACLFGIQNLTTPVSLLGDTFLRSVYAVYDLINNEIALAPTRFNETNSNIQMFAARGETAPRAALAQNQNSIDTPPGVREPAYVAAPGFQSGSVKFAGIGALAVVGLVASHIFVIL